MLNPKSIKAFIFDLGGVILNLDTSLTWSAFTNLGLPVDKVMQNENIPGGLLHRFETGHLAPADFISAMTAYLPQPCERSQFETAWNAMLLDIPVTRAEFLKKLKLKRPVYLLSNTNELHLAAIDSKLKEAFTLNLLDHLFTDAWFSCRVGMRKPDPQIFTALIEKHGMKASETLFIDDDYSNTEGARLAGLQVIHLRQGENIEDLLSEFIDPG